MKEEILTAAEAAENLRISRQRLYQLVREGVIPVILLGQRQYRFSKAALLDFINQGGSKDARKATD